MHERGTDNHNIVALEVKKPGVDLAHDRVKLEALKQQYGYLCAAHIIIGMRGTELVREVRWIDS